MSSKLVVSADIFNLFETEKFSKLQTERRDSSSSENNSKSDQIKNIEDSEETAVKKENIPNNTHKFSNILIKNHSKTIHKLIHLKPEQSDILDKIESGETNMNCSNKDKLVNNNNVDESHTNGEPPRETNVPTFPSMTGQVEISPLQTVTHEGPAQLQTINNKSKVPVFLVKNSSGKSVPLLLKKSVFIKNSESFNNNRTLIQVPNNLNSNKIDISTPILFLTPSKPSEVLINKTENSENSTEITKEKFEISTKISTEISTKTSTAQVKPKLIINRKSVAAKSEYHQNVSTPSTSSNVSTVQEFIIKTPSGKQIIIPNKIKPLKKVPKVEISEKNAEEVPQFATKNVTYQPLPNEKNTQHPINHNLSNTKNIIINNQLVPVNFNTKFKLETGSNTQQNVTENNDTVLNIITKKTADKTKIIDKIKTSEDSVEQKRSKRKQQKLKQPKINVKIPEEKLYQIQVREEKSPNFIKPTVQNKNITKNCAKLKDEVDLLKGCMQMPMYVENWTQTDVKLQDIACQTDVYVAPPPLYEPVDEECPNIPELIEYLLDNSKYSTGLDEITKTDIINNSLKFKPPEPAPMAPVTKPTLTLKERLFFDLRDCIGLDFLGNMPIHNAVLDNSLIDLKRQIFALRLRRFNVDVLNNFDQTALQLAVIDNKNKDIITALLVNGANVFVKDTLGNTLLHLAVLNTNHTILELILGYLNKDTVFLNTKNDEGLSALMVASIECKPESVAVLLKFGADPNLRDDKSGRTALFHAVELNNVSVITMLLQNKADPKIRNYFGLTALDAVKDLNTPVANLMERQATRTNSNAEASTSPKKRVNNKRRSDTGKNNKIAVVSKKLKVDLDSLEKQQSSASGSVVNVKQVSPPMRKRT